MAITRLGLSDPEHAPKPVPLIGAGLIAGLAAAVLAIALFAWISEEMLEGSTLRFDSNVRMWVHGFASPAMTRAMRVITDMGSIGVIAGIAISIAVFLAIGWKRAAGWIAINAAGASLLELTLKNAFHRPRPVPFFGTVPHTYSFPSGHSMFSFCFYGVLAGLITARVRARWWRIAIWTATALLVAAIGFSRIYLGVHYPSDVIAGYLVALVWVNTLVVLDRVRKTRKGLKIGNVMTEAEE